MIPNILIFVMYIIHNAFATSTMCVCVGCACQERVLRGKVGECEKRDAEMHQRRMGAGRPISFSLPEEKMVGVSSFFLWLCKYFVCLFRSYMFYFKSLEFCTFDSLLVSFRAFCFSLSPLLSSFNCVA